MKQIRAVYRLWHNFSAAGRVGYIGKDSNHPRRLNLFARKKEKLCRVLYRALNKYPLWAWHTEVLASGFKTEKSLSAAEMFYIRKFDSKNRGYNCTDGGEGVKNPTTETRARMSRAQLGNTKGLGIIPSAATRKKISLALKGRKFSKEHKAKISASRVGMKASAETRAKLSLVRLGNTYAKGFKHTTQIKKQISESMIRARKQNNWSTRKKTEGTNAS